MPNFNAINRGVYIADNLAFLRAINNDSVDLVTINPPFAKNETFPADKLKPPLSHQEIHNEKRLLDEWGIHVPKDAANNEIAWPYGTRTSGGHQDAWSWENDIHEDWINSIENPFPAVNQLIDLTRCIHSESMAAYLCYMAIRLIEIRRILKPAASLFLHCDHTAGGYLRQLLDAIFGNGENGSPGFRNEIAWCYTGPSNTRRWFPRKHDTIFWYSKSEQWTFNRDAVRIPHQQLNTPQAKNSAKISGRLNQDNVDHSRGRGRVPESWWADISPAGRLITERTGYPAQKPIALAERIIKAVTNPGDVVVDCFVLLHLLGYQMFASHNYFGGGVPGDFQPAQNVRRVVKPLMVTQAFLAGYLTDVIRNRCLHALRPPMPNNAMAGRVGTLKKSEALPPMDSNPGVGNVAGMTFLHIVLAFYAPFQMLRVGVVKPQLKLHTHPAPHQLNNPANATEQTASPAAPTPPSPQNA